MLDGGGCAAAWASPNRAAEMAAMITPVRKRAWSCLLKVLWDGCMKGPLAAEPALKPAAGGWSEINTRFRLMSGLVWLPMSYPD
jgi:hypothetical protein